MKVSNAVMLALILATVIPIGASFIAPDWRSLAIMSFLGFLTVAFAFSYMFALLSKDLQGEGQ